MKLDGARVLVAGATGVLGGKVTARLARAGSRLAITGRNRAQLARMTDAYAGTLPFILDVRDLTRCGEVVDDAARLLGGLDALVVASGVSLFGNVTDVDDVVATEAFNVNTLAPMAMTRAAIRHLGSGSVVAVVSAVLADYPTAAMADYSASKAGLSAWLTAVRREQRGRSVTICDLRPPHMDTGLASRALTGNPPSLPEPFGSDEVADHVIEAMTSNASHLSYDLAHDRIVLR